MSDPHRRRFSAPDVAPQPAQKTLKYSEADEHMLRRIASAMVLHWDVLSDDVQDLIIDQAAIVVDRTDAPHEAGDIENFIRNVKVTAITKPSAPAAKATD